MRNNYGHVVIKNPAAAHQFINFDGLEFEGNTPTDVDAKLEWHHNYIYYEFKFRNADLPTGQRISLEHTADDLRLAGRRAVVFVCSHNVRDPREDVRGADAIVTSVYYEGRWHEGTGRTAKDMTRSFLAWCQALGT